MKKALLRVVGVALVVGGLVMTWRSREARPTTLGGSPPAVARTDAEPVQKAYAKAPALIPVKGWELQPLASFQATARVLAITPYLDGAAGELAPYDVAVGWGPLAQEVVLEKLAFSQKDRFMHWRYWTERPPVSEREIITHTANIHVIPADAALLEKLRRLKVGAVVKMEGDLVEARHPRAEHPWRSSLSREDTGEGACELLYLRELGD